MQQAQKSRLLTAFLTSISITASFGLAFYWNFEKPFWAGFTALLISMSTIGQSVQKSLLRMVGTVAGALVGLAFLSQWGQMRWPLLIVLGLYVMLMVFFLLRSSKSSYFFYTATVVTVLIVVQSRAGSPPFPLAVARLEETLLGVMTYTFFALIFWPRASLPVLRSLTLQAMAAPARLFAARGDILSGKSGVDPAPYQQARTTAMRVSGLLPAARLEDYTVRRDAQEWNLLFSMTDNLFQLQQDFLLRLERLDTQTRQRLFPELEADLDALANQLTALSAWKPPHDGPSLADEDDADDSSALASPESAKSAPPAPMVSLEPLTLRVTPNVPAEDVVTVQALRDTFTRQSRLVLGLLDSLDFLLGGAGGRKAVGTKPDPSASEPVEPPSQEWVTLAQLRQVGFAAVLYSIAVLLWIYWNPPGTPGTVFVEMTIMIGMIGFLAGRVEPLGIVVAFGLGCATAALLYFGVMPMLDGFTQLACLMLIVTFGVTWMFYLPAQAMLRTGMLIPWFALSGLTNTRVFEPAMFLTGALTLMLCASTIALVFYVSQGGHPARHFRGGQRHFMRALAFSLAAAPQAETGMPFRQAWRSLRVAWNLKLVRDLAPELLTLSFDFSEEERGLEPRSVKRLALSAYEVARLISERNSLPQRGLLPQALPSRFASESAWLDVLRRQAQDLRTALIPVRPAGPSTGPSTGQPAVLPSASPNGLHAGYALADALDNYLDSAGSMDWQALAVEEF